MAIQFQCDSCGKSLRTDESKAGRKVKCPGCDEVITIPQPEFAFDDDATFDSQDDEAPVVKRKPKKTGKSREQRISYEDYTLADPVRRLLAAMLDVIVAIPFFIPAALAFGFGLTEADRAKQPPSENMIVVAACGLFVVGVFALLGINIYLLASRSQMIGKWILKIQIMDYETNEPAGFLKSAILRGFVNGLIGAIPMVGSLYSLVDILFIFGEEHRCLHDQLAGTYVANIP